MSRESSRQQWISDFAFRLQISNVLVPESYAFKNHGQQKTNLGDLYIFIFTTLEIKTDTSNAIYLLIH